MSSTSQQTNCCYDFSGRVIKDLRVTSLQTDKFGICCTKSPPGVLNGELFYTTRTEAGVITFELLDYIPFVPSGVFSGISISHMSNSAFERDTDTKISFFGNRVPNTNVLNSGILLPQFKETIAIQVPGGTVSGETTYDDPGSGFETTVPEVTYSATGGTGAFQGASTIQVIFDNDGVLFGRKFSRKIFVFGFTQAG